MNITQHTYINTLLDGLQMIIYDLPLMYFSGSFINNIIKQKEGGKWVD